SDRAARAGARGSPARADPAGARRWERQGRAARSRARRGQLVHDHTGAAPTRVPGRGEAAVREHLDGIRAAEEEVAPAPADDGVAVRRDPVELVRVEAALAVDVRLVD